MSSHSLIWAAVSHNSDGVVFQVRIVHGLQRFYVPRGVLEEVFDLERRASDARQLEHFYLCLNRILAQASAKRSIASSDTVPLRISDFNPQEREQRSLRSHEMARSAM
ncbi:hypothetical protein [Paraburkholderia fungorum]|uniref:hypothetical protein n=1 Tax=Paraburkholderia fungorum TaxID=134537 RepID=UPI0038BABE40